MKTILLLASISVLVSLWFNSAVDALATNAVCPVGQLGACKDCDFCNARSNEKCLNRCKEMYPADVLLGASCSAERSCGKRECICHLKCVNAGCWGDPHCWSFDKGSPADTFGYQGHCKHVMVKPCKKPETMPNFELYQSNKYWFNGPASILDISEFRVPEFGEILEITAPKHLLGHYTMKVNGLPTEIPYRFSRINECKEDFIYVHYAPDNRNQLVVDTSFGLKIRYDFHQAGPTGYSDISVDIPQHPELEGNTCGLLGKWNKNPDDDYTDETGKNYKNQVDVQFSWEWGNHWIVPGSCGPKPDNGNKPIDEKDRVRLEQLCKQNFEDNKVLVDCARAAGIMVPSAKDCALDLLFIGDEAERLAYIRSVISKIQASCPGQTIPTPDRCPPQLCCVTVYEHGEGSKSRQVCGRVADLGPFFDVNISTIKNDQNCVVAIFKGKNFGGQSACFMDKQRVFCDANGCNDWNDKVQSMIVTHAPELQK